MNRLGVDVGSTTIKLVLTDEDNNILYKRYHRHRSAVYESLAEFLRELEEWLSDEAARLECNPTDEFLIGITGSGGMSLAQDLGIKFEQEVIACSEAINAFAPGQDVAIELGGEDAKLTFYGDSVEQRMNGACAGGTGAFIDQMAILLNTDAQGLNELAKGYETIYPIAARCGVFAKSDIQPLLNEGVRHEDIAASVFQAVAEQTITGLSCGRVISGKVIMLGGPLTFLPQLRERFKETLGLSDSDITCPENSQYFVAMGAALLAEKAMTISSVIELALSQRESDKIGSLPPLFETKKDYEDFCARHSKEHVPTTNIKEVAGPVFIGIDAGSTTTKLVALDSFERIIFSDYKNNGEGPVRTALSMMAALYKDLPDDAFVARVTTTGYGESLIGKALNADYGEIETIAHYKAAKALDPETDLVLDIGGQDMKCIRIKDGAVYSIMLNEACSSGCGSFLETFAKSLNMGVEEFARLAIDSKSPVDLGTRCTVFMNSKVKQAQKEGAPVADISAGLAYSVIKNTLYKVMKLRSPKQAGQHIVVQGGTFLNDAVLRCMEILLGRNVTRPDISGLMGAYGAARISMERFGQNLLCDGSDDLEKAMTSSVISKDDIASFNMKTTTSRCKGCENRCLLTICSFSGHGRHVTGNRCERFVEGKSLANDDTNMYVYEYRRLFDYVPIPENKAPRGIIGIPRVLNMYEDYPFWFTFFTRLGFSVRLSPDSNKSFYELGRATIPSDTVCYPAKLVHGHIQWLLNSGVKRIFYPIINRELKEDNALDNNFNCPVVALYPDVIRENMDDCIADAQADFICPVLPYNNTARLSLRLYDTLSKFRISRREIFAAVRAGRAEAARFKDDIQNKAQEIIRQTRRDGGHGIVLAGRPYHLDPEINHGIDRLISSYGLSVLTENSIARLGTFKRKLHIHNQWTYHNRLFKAASFCTDNSDFELVQLNSFGCGIDAITTDEVESLLAEHGRLYTVLKIDENAGLGTLRIRIRSLLAAIRERSQKAEDAATVPAAQCNVRLENMESLGEPTPWRVLFDRNMKKKYTILLPQMLPLHFELFEYMMNVSGFNVRLLPNADRQAVEIGLKYINNDACYPTIITCGTVLEALLSGKYDLNSTAVFLFQTGGPCRASNYVALLRKALHSLGMSHVPIVSVNFNRNLERNPGFKYTAPMGIRALYSMLYGDLLMRVSNATRPYERVEGATNRLLGRWMEKAKANIRNMKYGELKQNFDAIVSDFDSLERVDGLVKPKVGVVGEILVKYHPDANNHIVEMIEREHGEAVVPDLLDFFMYTMKNLEINAKMQDGSRIMGFFSRIAIKFIYSYRRHFERALSESRHFSPPIHIDEIANKASCVATLGEQCGEGWILAGEMTELIDSGVENIVCLQPFACLPNHIVGRSIMKPLKKRHPKANIVAIDYDAGISLTNQINRLKLMMAVAHRNLKGQNPKPAGT